MTAAPRRSAAGIQVGDELPPFALDVTATVIVAGAIASRDFMPAHHDPVFARAQGAPDVFMNILTTNGYVARYVTDWAGPEAMVQRIAIRLGAPAVPGQPLHFSGRVTDRREADGECVLVLAVRAANDLGEHATGTVTVSLPAGAAGGAPGTGGAGAAGSAASAGGAGA